MADGRLYTASIGQNGVAICRYTRSGLPDSTFGTNGTSLFSQGHSAVMGIGITGDGHIAIAGHYFYDAYYTRLDSNGTLDSSLCSNGICFTDIPGRQNCNDAIIYPDGKALIAEYDGYTYLIKLKADGKPDSSFGVDGNGVLTVPGLSTFSLREMPDGRIICAGQSDKHFAIVRVLKDGQGIDTTFGNRGIIITNVGGGTPELAGVVALQADGKILAGGRCIPDPLISGHGIAAAIVRYMPNAPLGVPKAQEPANGKLKIYPNPAKTSLRIEVPGPGLLQLYSSEGRVLLKRDCTGPLQELNIASLLPGTYFLRLQAAGKSYSSLFVKE